MPTVRAGEGEPRKASPGSAQWRTLAVLALLAWAGVSGGLVPAAAQQVPPPGCSGVQPSVLWAKACASGAGVQVPPDCPATTTSNNKCLNALLPPECSPAPSAPSAACQAALPAELQGYITFFTQNGKCGDPREPNVRLDAYCSFANGTGPLPTCPPPPTDTVGNAVCGALANADAATAFVAFLTQVASGSGDCTDPQGALVQAYCGAVPPACQDSPATPDCADTSTLSAELQGFVQFLGEDAPGRPDCTQRGPGQLNETFCSTFTGLADLVVAVDAGANASSYTGWPVPLNGSAALFGQSIERLPVAPPGAALSCRWSALVPAAFVRADLCDTNVTFATAGSHILTLEMLVGGTPVASDTLRADIVPAIPIVISLRGPGTALEGQLVSYEVSATPRGTRVSQFTLPAGAEFTFDNASSTGFMNWTPTFAQAGLHAVQLNGTFGPQVGYFFTNLTVANANRPVAIELVDEEGMPLPGPVTVYERGWLNLTATASDPDGGEPVLGLESNSPGAIAAFEPTTGDFAWEASWDEPQEVYLNFTAMDGEGSLEFARLVVPVTRSVPRLTILDQPPATVAEGATLAFNVSTDPPGLVVASEALPDGATLSEGDGKYFFQWVPAFDQAGPYSLEFSAERHDLTGTAAHAVAVTQVNQAPSVSLYDEDGPVTSPEVEEGSSVAFTLLAEDLDEDIEAFALATDIVGEGLEVEDVFDDFTGEFAWTPVLGDAGHYYANFTATDSAGNSGFVNVTLRVTPGAPVLVVTEAPEQAVGPGDLVEFNVSAAPQDAVVAFNGTLPAGATFEDTGLNHTFSWTPTAAQVGTTQLAFNATRLGRSAEAVVPVVVSGDNRPPLVRVMQGASPIAAASVEELDPLSLGITFSDADGDVLEANWTTDLPIAEDDLQAAFDAEAGTFSWTPPLGAAGQYFLNFTAHDGNATGHRNVTVTVTAPAKPILAILGAPASLDEGQTLWFNVSVQPAGIPVMPNGTLPAGASFTFTPATGHYAFRWPIPHSANGTHQFAFKAFRKGAVGDAVATVIVGDDNRPPSLNLTGPLLVVDGDFLNATVHARYPLVLQAVTADPDGDIVELDVETNATGSLFDATNGTFAWTPGENATGTYYATIYAWDGTWLLGANVSIRVLPFVPATLGFVGLPASSPEGQLLRFNVTSSPAEAVPVFNGTLAVFPGATFEDTGANWTFQWTPNHTAAGNYTLRFNTTLAGRTTDAVRQVTITNTNRAPVLAVKFVGNGTAIPSTVLVTPGQPLALRATATDVDGDALTFSVSTQAAGTFDAANGTFTVTAPADATGNHLASFAVADGTVVAFRNVTLRFLPAPEVSTPDTGTGDDGTGQTVAGPLRPADAASVQELEAALGLAGALTDVLFRDTDADGAFDEVRDAARLLTTAHAVESSGLLLVTSGSANVRVLMDTATGDVFAVQPVPNARTEVFGVTALPADDTQDEDGASGMLEVRDVALSIAQKSGWIEVVFPDPAPGFDVASIARSDGTPISPDHAWREGGMVHFLDDPAVTYHFRFTQPMAIPGDATEPQQEGFSLPAYTYFAAGALAILVAIVLLVRRYR